MGNPPRSPCAPVGAFWPALNGRGCASPSPKGGPIDWRNFDNAGELRRQYKKCRSSLPSNRRAKIAADDDQLAETLERYDPETFVLAPAEANGEEALERVLDLLPDVPAGKLAIAELPAASADDVGALERAGFDGVIVEPRRVADLVGDAPPDV